MVFNLKEMGSSLNQARSQTQTRRTFSSKNAFEKGMAALLQAQMNGFEDKRPLHRAREFFFEAIHNQRKAAAGYLGMGYLLLLLDQPQKALKYLTQAQKLDDGPQTQEMLDFCLSKISPQDPSALSSDQEQVLEQTLEQDIKHFTRILFQRYSVEYKFYSGPELKALQEAHQQTQTALEQFELRLNTLAASLEITRFHLILAPLQQQGHMYQDVISASVVGQNLQQDLQNIQSQVSQALQEPHLNWESALEAWLDRLDAVADQLDEYESQGWEISTVLQAYEYLLPQIEHLQDLLDAPQP